MTEPKYQKGDRLSNSIKESDLLEENICPFCLSQGEVFAGEGEDERDFSYSFICENCGVFPIDDEPIYPLSRAT